MDIDVREIINIPKIQSMGEALFAATGIASAMVAINGEMLTRSGWRAACTQFHRNHPEAFQACKKSNILVRDGLLEGKKQVVYTCPHGLIGAAAPIIIDGNHVANIITGQFFFHKPDEKEWHFFQEQTEKYGFDKKAYLEAISKIPVITEDRLDSIMDYLSRFAEIIEELGYANLKSKKIEKQFDLPRDVAENPVLERAGPLHAGTCGFNESDQRYNNLIDNLPDILYRFCEKKGFFFVSNRVERILGYRAQYLTENPFAWKESIHPEDKKSVERALSKAKKEGFFDISYRIKDAKGNWHWFRDRSISIFEKAGEFIIEALASDITQRVKVEKALADSQRQLTDIIEFLPFPTWAIDNESRLIAWNRAVERLTGVEKKAILGKGDYAYAVPFYGEARPILIDLILKRDEQWEKKYISIEEEEDIPMLSVSFHPLLGEQGRYLAGAATKLYDAQGNIVGAIETVRDITDQRKAEEKLKRSNQDLEHFAYVASHDLQEPLRAIVGFLQLLEKRLGDQLDEKGKHYINRSVKAGHRMQKMIQEMLTLSRVNTKGGTFKLADLNIIIQKTLDDLHSIIDQKKPRITCAKLPTVNVDADQIRSLFQNLILNAIKYNESDTPVIEIGSRDDGKYYRFFIKDNGIGIEPMFHKRIFLIFQRLHTNKEYPGTGLGLALCKKIVERHAGTIWVESRPQEGSVFYFTLSAKR
ncbi:MAG: PAS domain S-box protein [Desulfobacteraceae bacterium]|nr:PAS domain S-box protein [Desulfobacteraceae bacterium]